MNIEDIRRRKMNSFKGESWDVRINCLFWIERLFLFLLFLFPTQVFDLIVPLILSTTLLALPFFLFFNPNLSSVGPSGIGGFWLFLLDRSMFYLCLEYSQLLAGGFDLTFLWRLIISLSLVIHSIYIADHLLRSYQPVLPTPISTGDVSKVKELLEDGKKMMTSMEQMIHSALENLRKEWGEFRDDWKKEMMTQVDFVRDDMRLSVDEICAGLLDDLRSKVAEDIIALGQDCIKKVKAVADKLDETYLSIQETSKEAKTRADETYLVIQETTKEAKTRADETHLEGQNKRRMIRGEDVEGYDMRLSVDEICAGLLDDLRSKVAEDIIALGQDCIKKVKAVADKLDETYLAIQETAKEAKTRADETYLVIQETAKEAKTRADETHLEGQNKRRMIRGEDVEGFVELREQVRRMSVEAEIAAEEHSRATVELVDARMQQWDQDNADYLASLPLLYFNQIV